MRNRNEKERQKMLFKLTKPLSGDDELDDDEGLSLSAAGDAFAGAPAAWEGQQ